MATLKRKLLEELLFRKSVMVILPILETCKQNHSFVICPLSQCLLGITRGLEPVKIGRKIIRKSVGTTEL